jgi:hypothetical protein
MEMESADDDNVQQSALPFKPQPNNLQAYSIQHHFCLSTDTKDFFDMDGMKVARRGVFYCSSLSQGRKRGDACPFKINFNYNKSIELYEFRVANWNHSHELISSKLMIDGKTFIKYERELEEAEVSVIHLLSATKLSIPQFEVNLASVPNMEMFRFSGPWWMV